MTAARQSKVAPSSVSCRCASFLRLLLPAPAFVLLPIADCMAGDLGRLVVVARPRHGVRVAPIEDEHHARIGRYIAKRSAVDQEAHARAVRIILGRGEVDWMRLGRAV